MGESKMGKYFGILIIMLVILFGLEWFMYQMGLHIDAILDKGKDKIGIAEREILIQNFLVIIKRL